MNCIAVIHCIAVIILVEVFIVAAFDSGPQHCQLVGSTMKFAPLFKFLEFSTECDECGAVYYRCVRFSDIHSGKTSRCAGCGSHDVETGDCKSIIWRRCKVNIAKLLEVKDVDGDSAGLLMKERCCILNQ